MSDAFDITEADIGRYVRRLSAGEVSKVVRDPGNGWLHPGSIRYEWKSIRDDLEYVTVAAVNERDAGRQRTAVHGTKEQLADALHTVTVERDALRQQFDGNEEPCVICDELCSSYAGNPNKWPVRLGNDGWRHIGCVNKQLAERDVLRQALEEAREALQGFNLKEDMVVAGQAGHLVLRVPLDAIANGAAALAPHRRDPQGRRQMSDMSLREIVDDLEKERDMLRTEVNSLRQALGDIIKLCPKVLHGERDVVDIAEIAHAIFKGGGSG